MVRGVVKFFDRDKGFGFLTVSADGGGSKDVFFHIYNRQTFLSGEYGAVLNQPDDLRERIPMEGEEVWFEYAPGKNDKPQASPWAFHEEYVVALREYASQTFYRILRTNGRSKAELWRGSDLKTLILTAATAENPETLSFQSLTWNGQWEDLK